MAVGVSGHRRIIRPPIGMPPLQFTQSISKIRNLKDCWLMNERRGVEIYKSEFAIGGADVGEGGVPTEAENGVVARSV